MSARIRIRQGGEITEAEAWPCGVTGLAIARRANREGVEIVHVRSGTCVGYFPDAGPEAALAAAQEIGMLADWTLGGSQLRAMPGLDLETDRVLSRWGGTARGGPAPQPVDLPGAKVTVA